MEEVPKEDHPDWQLLQFFKKIMSTVFTGLLWMLINIFLGLYLGFGIPENATLLQMILFYSWLALSLTAFIYFIWRTWRRKLPPP